MAVLTAGAWATAWVSTGCTIEAGPLPPDEREVFVPEPPAPPFIPNVPADGPRRVKILHTNDEHSHLLGFAPNSEYPFLVEDDGTVDPVAVITRLATDPDLQTEGGLVRRQYLINKIRAESADPVLLLSGGDVMMGTVFHAATAAAAPDYLAMALLGYDFVTLGNHEFDFGPDQLSASIQTAHRATFGGAVPILASNMHCDDVQPGGSGSELCGLMGPGDSGAPIMPWATKVLPNGLKVGFLGLVGYDAALVAPAKSPIAFSTPTNGAACTPATAGADCDGLAQCVRGHCVDPLDVPGHLAALAADAQAAVNTLRNDEGVDLVIALTHLGSAEDQFVAANTSGIDVIIGGHSHEEIAPFEVNGTIIVQAGSYGRKLGELTIEVDPAAGVRYVPEESTLHAVDGSLDAGIFGDTDPINGVPSVELTRALTLTGTVIGPVVAGLNAQLGPALGSTLFAPVVTSDHDVVGERPFVDTPLLQLVTDAVRGVVGGGMCRDQWAASQYLVAVQANGVVRESLRFSEDTQTTTLADVFRVLPLGASPFETTPLPGYPTVMFSITPIELYVGAEIGVTNGLEADSFFLGYSGMRITYDPSLPPFDPALAQTADTGPNGRITRIELLNDGGTYDVVFEYDAETPVPWIARWDGGLLNPASDTVAVVTNLYIAGFLDAFGITPRNPQNGTVYEADPGQAAIFGPSMAVLGQTVLCQTGAAPACPGTSAIAPCYDLAGDSMPWPGGFVEVKEWGALLQYLGTGLGGVIPAGLYADDETFEPRVIDASVTP